MVGLLGALGLATACNDRKDGSVRDNARQVGKQVGNAVHDVGEKSREAVQGLREGYQESRAGNNTGAKPDSNSANR
jgi:hypothetical protein